jgi:hypothetical protein
LKEIESVKFWWTIDAFFGISRKNPQLQLALAAQVVIGWIGWYGHISRMQVSGTYHGTDAAYVVYRTTLELWNPGCFEVPLVQLSFG